MTSLTIPNVRMLQWLGIGRQLKQERVARPTRQQIALWAMLLPLVLVLFMLGYQKEQIGVFPDESQYIVLAQSLAQAAKYGLINYPGPLHTAPYPFGYPLLLAPFIRIFPNNLDALRLPSLLATLINIGILFWAWPYFTRRLSYWWGLGVTALYALSPLTISHSWFIMSEPLYLTFSLLALILTEQAARRREGRWWSAMLSLVLMFVLFTRSAGITLVLSVFVYLAIVRGRQLWRQLLFVVLGILFWTALVDNVTTVQIADLLPVKYINEAQTTTISVPSSPVNRPPDRWVSRLQFFITQNLAIDVRAALIPLGGGQREQEVLTQIGVPTGTLVIGLALCLLVLVGLIRWFRRDGLLLSHMYLAVYWVMLFVWVWNSARLLYPILPQMFVGFLLGVEALVLAANRIKASAAHASRLPRIVLPALVALMLVIAFYRDVTVPDTREHIGDTALRTHWLKLNSKRSDVVMSEFPETDYLYAERKTVAYPAAQTNLQADGLHSYLRAQNVQYVLVGPHRWWQEEYTPSYSSESKRLLPLLSELITQSKVSLVYSDDRNLIQVYRVLP